MYNLRYFNEVMIFGKSSTGAWDHMTVSKNTDSKRDVILDMVISGMRRAGNWVEFYGINIIDTMELELPDYTKMFEALLEHNNKERSIVNDAESDLRKQINGGK